MNDMNPYQDIEEPAVQEQPAFMLGGYYHSVDCGTPVSWEQLRQATIGTQWQGSTEMAHWRQEETADVVWRDGRVVVVVHRTRTTADGATGETCGLRAYQLHG